MDPLRRAETAKCFDISSEWICRLEACSSSSLHQTIIPPLTECDCAPNHKKHLRLCHIQTVQHSGHRPHVWPLLHEGHVCTCLSGLTNTCPLLNHFSTLISIPLLLNNLVLFGLFLCLSSSPEHAATHLYSSSSFTRRRSPGSHIRPTSMLKIILWWGFRNGEYGGKVKNNKSWMVMGGRDSLKGR